MSTLTNPRFGMGVQNDLDFLQRRPQPRFSPPHAQSGSNTPGWLASTIAASSLYRGCR